MKNRVILYARVSTSDGRQDADVQLSQLRRYCRDRDFNIVAEHVDEMSGVAEKRPEFDKMMDACRKRKTDCILVFRFDRFARSVKIMIEALEEFQALGIDFISFMENIDTGTALGKCMFTIISAFSAMEREIIKERVSAGLQRAREKGVQLGRPRKGFDVDKALELKRQGLSVRTIAGRVGVSYGTVHRHLRAVTKTHA